MKIIAESTLTGADPSEHLRAEAQRVWDLYASGVLREMYWKGDNSGAVLVLEVEGTAAAWNALATLPLVVHGLTQFRLVPVGPLIGLEALHQTTVEP